MSMPRATKPQLQAIRNLMYNVRNLSYAADFLIELSKQYLSELSVAEAKELIADLILQSNPARGGHR